MKKSRKKRFTLQAGRSILVDGEPFIYIAREEGTTTYPSVADEAAHLIVDCLNRSRLKVDRFNRNR